MSDDLTVDFGAYCRQIEAYLCRTNGGHLVRIVGPAFEMVSGWARRGIPLKVVFRGIDHRVQRHQEQGSGRRRPVRVEFCEADVLDAFDAWKRAVGRLAGASVFAESGDGGEEPGTSEAGRSPSLPAHIRRTQLRLTTLVASQHVDERLRAVIGEVLARLDPMHTEGRTARGETRLGLLSDLQAMDTTLMTIAWDVQDESTRAALRAEATGDLAPFRERMSSERWEAAAGAAARRLLRDRLGLPTLALE